MGVTGPEDDQTLRRIGPELVLAVWQRRKWVALVVFAAAFTAIASLAVWLPNLYRATATVLVETQQVSEAFVRPTVTSELETRIQRIRQELTSRTRLGALITELDLYGDLRKNGVPFDAVIERMRRDVDLELQGADQMSVRSPTIAFSISYTGSDPETVAKVANVLASYYVDENSRMRTGQAAKTAEILKGQLAAVKTELDAQDQRSSAFKLTHLGELPQQVEANLGSLERLNTQLRLNSENQIRSMDRRDRIESQLAEPDPPAAPPTPSPRAAELAKLRQELTELRREFSDAYPDVIRKRAEIAALERQEQESAATVKPAAPVANPKERLTQLLGEVQRELTSLKEEELTLRSAIAAYEKRVDNVPKRQEEFQELSRDYQTTKDRYDTLLKQYGDAQLAETLERGQKVEQFRILDPAIPSKSPAAPPRLRLILAGFVLSMVLAVVVVVLAEKLDTSFHTADDLRSCIPGPTLFSIPLIETPRETRRQWRRAAVAFASVVIALALIVAGLRYVATGNERLVRMVARGHV
jgi:succinoglycan biosynthesis transport protein ExoP